MMLERLLFTAISDGMKVLEEDPGQVEEFFLALGLDAAESAKARAIFSAKVPTVIHGYPQGSTVMPVVAITLMGDSEDTKFLGDEGAYDPDTETDEYAAIYGLSFGILIYGQHPDATLYFYHLVRAILINAHEFLEKEGALHNMRWNGADLAPDPSLIPGGVYIRRITLTASQEYTQPLAASKVGRAFKVRGIHVDARGDAGADTGGVLTQVTTTPEFGDPDGDEEDGGS